MSKRAKAVPVTPPDLLREHERKLLGDLQSALERYQEVLDIDWFPMVQPMVSLAVKYGAATTVDQFILLESVYKDQLSTAVGHRAEFAAQEVREALQALAEGFGWHVSDEPPKPPKKAKRRR